VLRRPRYNGRVLARTCLLLGLILAAVSSSSANDRVTVPVPCSMLPHWGAVFLGMVMEFRPDRSFRFRVDEKFKGVKGDYFDAEWRPGTELRFEVGKQYLIFAAKWRFGGPHHEHLVADPFYSRESKYAQAVLEQLRAEMQGKRNASVYGMLLEESELSVLPVAGVVVRLHSEKKSFETTTDARGAFAFERVPKGTYQYSADLPPNLLVDTVSGFERFELPRGMCWDTYIYAEPAAKAAGGAAGH